MADFQASAQRIAIPGKPRSHRMSTRIDFTPMVDLKSGRCTGRDGDLPGSILLRDGCYSGRNKAFLNDRS